MTDKTLSADYQNSVAAFVRREVFYCVSQLISDLAGAECKIGDHYAEDGYEIVSREDWREPLEDALTNTDASEIADGILDATYTDAPTIALTVAISADGASWNYQTGDNSFSGGAYGLPHWAVVEVGAYADADDVIADVFEQWDNMLSQASDDVVEISDAVRADVTAALPAIVADLVDEAADHARQLAEENLCNLDDDECREICEAARLEPYTREAYEHWLVSDWLADKLEEKGEMIARDLHGLTVWGRTTTGQAIYMDGVICEIFDELHASD
jgi:hypothetical protein